MSLYEGGSKNLVIARMAAFAIRDQQALVEAYTPSFGEPDDDAKKVIEECRSHIRDFRKVLAATKKVSAK
jgi:hypothetical protein